MAHANQNNQNHHEHSDECTSPSTDITLYHEHPWIEFWEWDWELLTSGRPPSGHDELSLICRLSQVPWENFCDSPSWLEVDMVTRWNCQDKCYIRAYQKELDFKEWWNNHVDVMFPREP